MIVILYWVLFVPIGLLVSAAITHIIGLLLGKFKQGFQALRHGGSDCPHMVLLYLVLLVIGVLYIVARSWEER